MKGRWTIWLEADGEPGEGGAQEVPVVPCDDAAIERAIAALRVRRPLAKDDEAREVIEIVLRAAGETP